MADPYQQLASYLDSLPAGYPPTDSGVELCILRKLFSPQEANLALHLTLIPEQAHVVAYRARQPLDLTAAKLEEMELKGLISASQPQDGGVKKYAISQFVVGFYEDQVNRLDREVAVLMEEYAPYFFENGPWKKLPQIRTIPVHESIPITSEVMPYEQAETILRSKTAFAVRNCICRQERQLLEQGCDKPMEVCMSFDGAALNTAASGKGRLINLEEALDILEQARRVGMVLQPANSKDPIFLCACCSCCCGILRNIKNQPRPSDLVANAFTAHHDPGLCSACGACLAQCPMDALVETDDGTIVHLPERCIGCGLCVGVCPSEALTMLRKPAQELPSIPRSTTETYIRLGLRRNPWSIFQMAGLAAKSCRDRLLAPRK